MLMEPALSVKTPLIQQQEPVVAATTTMMRAILTVMPPVTCHPALHPNPHLYTHPATFGHSPPWHLPMEPADGTGWTLTTFDPCITPSIDFPL